MKSIYDISKIKQTYIEARSTLEHQERDAKLCPRFSGHLPSLEEDQLGLKFRRGGFMEAIGI